MKKNINTNEAFNRANELMNESLIEYRNGNITEANNKRALANKLFDTFHNKIMTNEGKYDILYGECRNFGMLYKIFENNSHKMFESSNRHSQISKITKAITENKVLKDQFNAYNAFTHPVDVENPEEYVNEAISLIENHTKKELKENNEKLLELYKKFGIVESANILPNEQEIFEAIEYLILNKKSLSNVNEYSKVKKTLVECVKKNNVVSVDTIDPDKHFNESVEELTKNVNEALNDDEKELVMEVSSAKDKSIVFNKYKQETLNTISSKLVETAGDEREQVQSIYNKINEMSFNEKTCLLDIAKMIETKNIISE